MDHSVCKVKARLGFPGLTLLYLVPYHITIVIVIHCVIYMYIVCSSSGMCLGEKRLVTVPPRMGWSKNNAHHDTIRSFADANLAEDKNP